jgi:hypothetical protein
MQAKACWQAVGASCPPDGKKKMVVDQFGLMALLLLALKHKVLRSYPRKLKKTLARLWTSG